MDWLLQDWLLQDWQTKILDNVVWGTASAVVIALFADGIRILLRTVGVASGKIPTFIASVLKAFAFPRITFWVAFEPVLILLRIIFALLVSLSVVAAGAVIVCAAAYVVLIIFVPGGPAHMAPAVKDLLHLDATGFPTDQSLFPLAAVLTVLSTLLLTIPGMSGFIAGLGRLLSGVLFLGFWALLVRATFSLGFQGVTMIQDIVQDGGGDRAGGARIGAYIVSTIAALPILAVLSKQYEWSLKALGFQLNTPPATP